MACAEARAGTGPGEQRQQGHHEPDDGGDLVAWHPLLLRSLRRAGNAVAKAAVAMEKAVASAPPRKRAPPGAPFPSMTEEPTEAAGAPPQ